MDDQGKSKRRVMANQERYQKGARSKRALCDRLGYAVDREHPETQLSLAVIEQAAFDLRSQSKKEQMDARSFILSRRFSFWCDLIGLDEDYAREVISDHYPELTEEPSHA